MRTYRPFALPSTLINLDMNKLAREVKTKSFCNKHKRYLGFTASRLTTENIDVIQVIGSMLQAAYGYNIGGQIEKKLTGSDYIKIRENILSVVYG